MQGLPSRYRARTWPRSRALTVRLVELVLMGRARCAPMASSRPRAADHGQYSTTGECLFCANLTAGANAFIAGASGATRTLPLLFLPSRKGA